MEPATLRPIGSDPSMIFPPDDTTSLTIKAYFLVQAEYLTDFPRLLETVRGMDGVSQATRVIGPYDIVAESEALPEDSLDSMSGALASVEGVIRVVTAPGAVVSRDITGSPRAA